MFGAQGRQQLALFGCKFLHRFGLLLFLAVEFLLLLLLGGHQRQLLVFYGFEILALPVDGRLGRFDPFGLTAAVGGILLIVFQPLIGLVEIPRRKDEHQLVIAVHRAIGEVDHPRIFRFQGLELFRHLVDLQVLDRDLHIHIIEFAVDGIDQRLPAPDLLGQELHLLDGGLLVFLGPFEQVGGTPDLLLQLLLGSLQLLLIPGGLRKHGDRK